jgi:hypothetical protein
VQVSRAGDARTEGYQALGYKRASPQVIANENVLYWLYESSQLRFPTKVKYAPFSRIYVVDFVSCEISSVTKSAIDNR